MEKQEKKMDWVLMIALGLTFMLIMNIMFPQKKEAAPLTQPTAFPQVPMVEDVGVPDEPGPYDPETDYVVRVQVGKEGKGEHSYEATFSSVGASLVRYRLLGYYRVPADESPENHVVLLNRMARSRESLRVDSFTVGTGRQTLQGYAMRNARFHLVEAPAGAVIEPEPGADVKVGENLVFKARVGDWELVKTFRFPTQAGVGTDFTLDFDLEWRNLSDINSLFRYDLVGPSGMVADDDSAQFGVINFLTARQASADSIDVAVERTPLATIVKELKDGKSASSFDNRANLAWFGAKNRFFTAIVTVDGKALSDSNGAARLTVPGQPGYMPTEKDIQNNLKNQPEMSVATSLGTMTVPAFEEARLTVEPGVIEAGGTHKASYRMYAGPAVDDWLEGADARLSGVVSYTWRYLDFISRWLVRLLNLLDGVLGNYGFAIIAVTLIIKLLLHPLSRKSFVSMNKMQKLQPQIKEIQRKYSNDAMKMRQEMSKFQKEQGVSMAGGCLPIFLQLPIFLALYGAFSQGFSMRHAPFIPFWIQDLSKPDSLYDLGFNIPLLGSSHISLLPILYLVLQFWMMSLQPKPSDPQAAQQQKIMKYMPIMFVFIFYAMPAGLVLYFTISALCGVVENWWMRKYLMPRLGLGDTPAAAAHEAATAKAGTGAKAIPSASSEGKKKKKK